MRIPDRLLMSAAGLGLCLLLLIVAAWKSGTEKPALLSYDPAATSDERERSRVATVVASESAVASNFLKLDEMMAQARHDADRARLLAAYVQLCSSALGGDGSGFQSQRFTHPLWKAWLGQCDKHELSLLIEDMDSWAIPTGPGWDALATALEVNGRDRHESERDAIMMSLVSTSKDPELVAQAAVLYFRGTQGASEHLDLDRIGVDLALMLACRIGRDCSSVSIEVVAECAATEGCYPGASMEQVIALRRSPEELDFLRNQVEQVMDLRETSG